MNQKEMKKFCDDVAKEYAKDRIYDESSYKSEEWKIVKRYIKKNHKILDLCCGPGTFLISLTKKGYEIKGIDFSEGMLDEATKFAKKEKVKISICQGDATSLKEKGKTYNLILLLGDSIGSIPNSNERQKVINECYRLLKGKGLLIITFGNRNNSIKWWLKQLWVYIKSLFSKKLEFGDIPYELFGKQGIHHNYSKREANKSLKKSGFKIKEIDMISHKMIIVAKR